MQYQDVKPIERKTAEQAFSSGDPQLIAQALISITYHDTDWKWVQAKCILYLSSENEDVRGLAVTCLGHIARIHKKLHIDKVLPHLNKLLADKSISGRVKDTIDDIRMFSE